MTPHPGFGPKFIHTTSRKPNNCLMFVATPYMTRLFTTAFYLFIAGLAATLVMVSVATWGKESGEQQ
jgi:hypothetical protein